MTTPNDVAVAGSRRRGPADEEIDVYGLTHPGKVRTENQDHFLICSLRRQVDVHMTSLPHPERLPLSGDRLAFLAMVADGVGGTAKGDEASRLAVEGVTRYVAQSMKCYYATDPNHNDDAFIISLQEAALRCHEEVLRRGAEDQARRGMATTLTVWLGVWPRGYLLQVGDSRCYILRDGELIQVSRDQTMAQELVDQGILTRADAFNTRLANLLSSAIGGPEAAPVVTRMEQAWGQVGLLCSDGLTKHVSDERIRTRLVEMTSAKQACEALLQDALDGGGTDNITVLVGRVTPRGKSPL
jgi:serine/threonine protein phosphatase PrpC